jgi:hypothetical protein
MRLATRSAIILLSKGNHSHKISLFVFGLLPLGLTVLINMAHLATAFSETPMITNTTDHFIMRENPTK